MRVVFKNPYYTKLAFFAGFLFFLFSVYLSSYQVLFGVLTSSYPIFTKIKIILFLIKGFLTNFTFFGKVITIVISVLFGINFSLFLYFYKNVLKKWTGSGFLGVLFSVVGIGCVSCGSVILASIFGVASSAAFLNLLPFSGQEFGVLGALFLLYSIYSLSSKIEKPSLCTPGVHKRS